jgi:hypothetical protein
MTNDTNHNEVDVRDVLQRLEIGTLPVDREIRERVRQRTLALLDADDLRLDPDGPTELVRLVLGDSAHSARRLPTARLVLAAAAVVLVGMLGLNTLRSTDGSQVRAGEDGGTSSPPVAAISTIGELPQLLQPGKYETSTLGTPIAFTLDTSAWLVREDPGVLELSLDPNTPDARVFFVRPTDLSASLEGTEGVGGLAQWLNSRPDGFAVQSSAGRIEGELTEGRWTIFLGDSLVRSQGCEVGRVCVQLFERPEDVGLSPGGNNTVLQFDQGDLDPIFVITWSPQSAGLTTFGAFTSMMTTLEFGEPRPTPLRSD